MNVVHVKEFDPAPDGMIWRCIDCGNEAKKADDINGSCYHRVIILVEQGPTLLAPVDKARSSKKSKKPAKAKKKRSIKVL